MAKILYGAPVREKIRENLREKVKRLKKTPTLFIVQVGNREDSSIYINSKISFGNSIGVNVILNKFEYDISEAKLELEIKKIIDRKDCDGIIVQLPLPDHIKKEKILNLIPKDKDADGLSQAKDIGFSNVVTPATARAVVSLLEFYTLGVKDKKVVVLGKSILAGKPIADVLEKEGAYVKVFDKNSLLEDILNESKEADILVSATGNPNLVDSSYTNENQVVVDVGINIVGKNKNGKNILMGDVKFDEIKNLVQAITPVPGGIGVITVASLFENLLDLIE